MTRGVSRRTFLATGGMAAGSLAVGRFATAGDAGAQTETFGEGASGKLTLTEGSMIQLAVSPDGQTILSTCSGSSGRCPLRADRRPS